MKDVLSNEYVFWAITGAIGLLGGAVIFFLKRSIDKTDKRLTMQEERTREVESKLNKTIADMPFIYTTREDFIRATASLDRKLDNTERKLDQILTMISRGNNAKGDD